MNNHNSQVESFYNDAKKWGAELAKLREITLSTNLHEDYKWKQACYTYENANVLIVSPFKEYCALNFFKGALLNDSEGILVAPGENSQSARQIRFTSLDEIIEMEPIIIKYIHNAIEVEKSGLKIEMKKIEDYSIPQELEDMFVEIPELKTAFEALTPGRQRAYLLHFSQPKQPQTRVSRIQKAMDRIFDGKGMNDCICGLSKKMPGCDGSHKNIQK